MRNRLLIMLASSPLFAAPVSAMSLGEAFDNMVHDAQAIFTGEPTTQELMEENGTAPSNGSNGDSPDGPSVSVTDGSVTASANGASASISNGSISASANGASASISNGSISASANETGVSIGNGPTNGNGNAVPQ